MLTWGSSDLKVREKDEKENLLSDLQSVLRCFNLIRFHRNRWHVSRGENENEYWNDSRASGGEKYTLNGGGSETDDGKRGWKWKRQRIRRWKRYGEKSLEDDYSNSLIHQISEYLFWLSPTVLGAWPLTLLGLAFHEVEECWVSNTFEVWEELKFLFSIYHYLISKKKNSSSASVIQNSVSSSLVHRVTWTVFLCFDLIKGSAIFCNSPKARSNFTRRIGMFCFSFLIYIILSSKLKILTPLVLS